MALADFRCAVGKQPRREFVVLAVLSPPLHEGVDLARVVSFELLLDGKLGCGHVAACTHDCVLQMQKAPATFVAGAEQCPRWKLCFADGLARHRASPNIVGYDKTTASMAASASISDV
jgi:hypothetical protein